MGKRKTTFMKRILMFILLLGFVTAFSQIQEAGDSPSHTPNSGSNSPEQRKQAEYPGGINVFMKEVAKRIDTKRIKGGAGKTRSNAKFSVNTQGEIEQIFVTGNNETANKEVERVMRSMRTKWTPGEYKGTPVVIWYNLPFIINFE